VLFPQKRFVPPPK